jgi:hypothetical protein
MNVNGYWWLLRTNGCAYMTPHMAGQVADRFRWPLKKDENSFIVIKNGRPYKYRYTVVDEEQKSSFE